MSALRRITLGSHITYYSLIFFIAYSFKGQVPVFAGRVKIVSHSSCRTRAILKYFSPTMAVIPSIYPMPSFGINSSCSSRSSSSPHPPNNRKQTSLLVLWLLYLLYIPCLLHSESTVAVPPGPLPPPTLPTTENKHLY